jgi:acetyl-CoA acyltransferase
MPDAVIVSALRTPIRAALHGPADHRGRRELRVDVTAIKRRASSDKDSELVEWFPPTHPDRPDAPNMDMSITVGWKAAVKAGVSRQEMDELALRSHRKAIEAIDEGRFKHEIVPIETPHGLFEVDEHPRRDTRLERLAALKPLHPEIDGFSITAGNACGANDGAAVLTIASDRPGLPALARIRAWASVGVDPASTGLAPVDSIPKALGRARISLADVDLFEINEAFAAMCAGGGMGSATVIEVPAP